MVAQYDSATEACTALVKEAAACWKRFEGTYRDDITAIVVFLPFLEGEAEDMANQATPAQTAKQGAAAAEDDAHTYVNQGEVGLSRLEDIDLSPSTRARAAGEQAEGTAGADTATTSSSVGSLCMMSLTINGTRRRRQRRRRRSERRCGCSRDRLSNGGGHGRH